MTDMLTELERIIADRSANPQAGSYTNTLLDAGIARSAQKVGEEGVEVVVAALAQDRAALIGEISDLMYHLLVVMAQRDITLDDINAELARRHHTRAAPDQE